MFVILWDFEVKPGNEAVFERVYGRSGQWAQLFQQDPRYRGTKLLRDVSDSSHFYTVDYWDFESAYYEFITQNQAAYEEMDRATQGLTVRDHRVFSGESH